SLQYRTAGMIEDRIGGAKDGATAAAVFEEYAIEASIAKVSGSEVLDFVLDENIQIHGGNGFVKDYPAERHYRDARVNRIFEGTNEINRLLISGTLAKRAAKGDLPLVAAARALQDELLGAWSIPMADDTPPLAEERRARRVYLRGLSGRSGGAGGAGGAGESDGQVGRVGQVR